MHINIRFYALKSSRLSAEILVPVLHGTYLAPKLLPNSLG